LDFEFICDLVLGFWDFFMSKPEMNFVSVSSIATIDDIYNLRRVHAQICKRSEAKDFAGAGLKEHCENLNIPPVLSYGTCTDTGRLADLLAAISNTLGGMPIPNLPVVAAAPEYNEQKATIDAVFALALGFYTYLNPVPTVTGSPNLVKLLTQNCKHVTGGLLNVETDVFKAAYAMLAYIEANRKKWGSKC
jgi:carbon-monoxide dehydrogenase catalytic subunit